MKSDPKKAYQEPEHLKDILKRVLETLISTMKIKPFEAALTNEQPKKEV